MKFDVRSPTFIDRDSRPPVVLAYLNRANYLSESQMAQCLSLMPHGVRMASLHRTTHNAGTGMNHVRARRCVPRE